MITIITDRSDAERLMKFETELFAVKEVVLRLEAKIDARESMYVTRVYFDDVLKLKDEKTNSIQTQLTNFKAEVRSDKKQNKQMIPNWIGITISVLALTATVLIAAFK